MKHGSGWVHPIEEIDHPSCRWNRGDIYISEKDICEGVTLEPGDSVVFYLYVDAKGLGAENCVQVWHETGQAMRKAKEPVLGTSYMASNVTVDLSCFFQDFEDDDEESASEDATVGPKRTQIRLSECLLEAAPKGPPSLGSAAHAEGTCKRCSFFPKGTCTNGAECEFCHFEHEKRPKRHKRKNKKSQLAETDEADGAINEPMKCEIGSYLRSLSKDVFASLAGDSTPATSADDGHANLSDLSSCGSPPTMERQLGAVGGVCLPPPGLHPPPPQIPPPPMPEFLSALREKSIALTRDLERAQRRGQ